MGKQWRIRIRDLLLTTACIAMAIPLLQSSQTAAYGVLVLSGTFYGLVNAGRDGSYLMGFAWGVGVPLAAILLLALL